jgi:hypothetical protein
MRAMGKAMRQSPTQKDHFVIEINNRDRFCSAFYTQSMGT